MMIEFQILRYKLGIYDISSLWWHYFNVKEDKFGLNYDYRHLLACNFWKSTRKTGRE